MKFCLLLKFSEDDPNKAKFQVHLGHPDVNFEAEEGELALLGRASCFEDGFPLEFDNPEYVPGDKFAICEWLVHSGIASVIPKLMLASGEGNIHFTCSFPSSVDPGSILLIGGFTYYHKEQFEGKLAIKD